MGCSSYLVRIERQTRVVGEGGPHDGGPRLQAVEDALPVELGLLRDPEPLGDLRLVGDDDARRCHPQGHGEVGLEDLLDAGLLHDGLRHLALLGRGRLDPLQALPHLRHPCLEAVGHGLLGQRLPQHLADRLVEAGGTLEGVEEGGLINLGVGLNQPATEFGELGKFILQLALEHHLTPLVV